MSFSTSQIPGTLDTTSVFNGSSTSNSTVSCSASVVDYATLFLTMALITLAWWITDIPKLWQHGIRTYGQVVIWQCLRLVVPSVAGIFAVLEGDHVESWPRLYYVGPYMAGLPKHLSKFDYVRFIGIDLITVVTTIMSLSQFAQLPPDDLTKGWNISAYAYPTLSATIVGLWIIFASRVRLHEFWTIVFDLIVTLGLGAAITAVMYLITGSKLVWFAYLGYAWVAAPLVIFFLWFLPIAMAFACLSIFTRMTGVVAGALAQGSYFPYCAIVDYRYVLGAVYVALGCVSAGLALFGVISKVNRRLDLRKINRQRRQIEETHGIVLQTRDEDQQVQGGEKREKARVRVTPVQPKIIGKTTYGGRMSKYWY